jgi:hypothetical protein
MKAVTSALHNIALDRPKAGKDAQSGCRRLGKTEVADKKESELSVSEQLASLFSRGPANSAISPCGSCRVAIPIAPGHSGSAVRGSGSPAVRFQGGCQVAGFAAGCNKPVAACRLALVAVEAF